RAGLFTCRVHRFGLLLQANGSCWKQWLPMLVSFRNWCSYIVTRTVSCHVQNGTFLQRVFQGCRWPGGCNGGSYRAIVRPVYKVAYKTVTALEWKCCPGHSGISCEEGRKSRMNRAPGGRCLNCSKVEELTTRLNSLEAQVSCGRGTSVTFSPQNFASHGG
uniref:EMI domain-containing protein n=1 Tax=Chelonoidis abingdonii TaxID=106734 RepID=A0A8C0H6Q9_CHEAB